MTDSEIVNFLEELSARTYKSHRYPNKENPSGIYVCGLNTDIHIGGNSATVYIRGDSCNTVASGHGETFREALHSARDDYATAQRGFAVPDGCVNSNGSCCE